MGRKMYVSLKVLRLPSHDSHLFIFLRHSWPQLPSASMSSQRIAHRVMSVASSWHHLALQTLVIFLFRKRLQFLRSTWSQATSNNRWKPIVLQVWSKIHRKGRIPGQSCVSMGKRYVAVYSFKLRFSTQIVVVMDDTEQLM
jgi:hypothetical protein